LEDTSCFICMFVDVVSLHFVLCILNAIFKCMSSNSFMIFLASVLLYVKVVHFIFLCCRSLYSVSYVNVIIIVLL
jgi:hypothetical protein